MEVCYLSRRRTSGTLPISWRRANLRAALKVSSDNKAASSGEFVGDVAGSVRVLAQKEVKLPASGIKRALLQLFRLEGVNERATFVVDPVVQKVLDGFPKKGFHSGCE
jgi:hypothetical protein